MKLSLILVFALFVYLEALFSGLMAAPTSDMDSFGRLKDLKGGLFLLQIAAQREVPQDSNLRRLCTTCNFMEQLSGLKYNRTEHYDEINLVVEAVLNSTRAWISTLNETVSCSELSEACGIFALRDISKFFFDWLNEETPRVPVKPFGQWVDDNLGGSSDTTKHYLKSMSPY